jgi:hypothetical protein
LDANKAEAEGNNADADDAIEAEADGRHLPRRSHRGSVTIDGDGGREANAAALLFFPYPVPPGLNPCLSSASPPPRSTSPAAPNGVTGGASFAGMGLHAPRLRQLAR